MSIELRLLAYSVALLFVLILVQASAAVKAQDGKALAGNRDDLKPPGVMEGRTRRILYNHIEAMAMFAPLVLIAATSNVSNDATVLAARLFFYSRVIFAIVYFVGIPYLRTLVWLVGTAGTIMMFLALFGVIG